MGERKRVNEKPNKAIVNELEAMAKSWKAKRN